MKSFAKLFAASCLLTATLAADQVITGDKSCTNADCAGSVLTVEQYTAFSLSAAEASALEDITLFVALGSTLLSTGIDCDGFDSSCLRAEIEVISSDLTTNGALIECAPGNNGITDACTDMILVLADSTAAINCGNEDCNGLQVHLHGPSDFKVDSGSSANACATAACNLYFYSADATYDVSTITNFNVIDSIRPTSTTPIPVTTTGDVATTDNPVTTAKPVTTVKPVTTDNPMTTGNPVTTDKPVTTGSPVTTVIEGTTEAPLPETTVEGSTSVPLTTGMFEASSTQATEPTQPVTTESDDDDSEGIMDKVKKYKYFAAAAIGLILLCCCSWRVGRRMSKKAAERQKEAMHGL